MRNWLFLSCLLAVAASGCARQVAADPRPDAAAAKDIREKLVAKAGGGAAVAVQEAKKRTGWGTLKGRFVFDGPAPMPAALAVNKDLEVCGQHKLYDESLVVGSDGGLANVVLWLKANKLAADDIHPDYAAEEKAERLLDNKDCRFEPHVLPLRVGQTLLIKNSDAVGHNTNAALTNNSPFNDLVPANAEVPKTLGNYETEPKTVTCNIHPWMKGFVVVQPHPYMAVSAKDGTFEIKNLPAGVPLELQLWHESAGEPQKLGAGTGLETSAKGVMKVELMPDETRDLKDIKVPAGALAGK